MDRDKSKGLKRGPSKVKAHFVSDFIALGSKSSRGQSDAVEPKTSSKSTLSSSSSERKRDVSSPSLPSVSSTSKKPKLASSSSIPSISRAGSQVKRDVSKSDQWDSVAIEVEPTELLNKILEAEDCNDDEKIEALLCGTVKRLKMCRAKPETSLYLCLMYLAKTRPLLFCTDFVVEAFCSLLKRDVSVNFKTKGNSLVSVLSANVLLAAYHDEGSWPETFVKVYIEDALGERIWVDHDDCKGFVDNILTAFNTKMPPKSMLVLDRVFRPDACPSPPTVGTDDEEASCSSLSLESKENLENIAVLPRYLHSEDTIEKFVLDIIRDQLTRRQPMEVSRNTLRLLMSTCGISEVRYLVSQKLEMWLQNPKLTRPAQDLLLCVCINCNQHNQHDVDVISLLIKIRTKTKPVINHFLLCMKELLSQHTENLSTVLKHAIYNELSNTRNPNNMQLLSIIFQHSPERAAKVLAEVFQDLLINRDDYLRALRVLLREIVRTVRYDLNFSTFCLGLLQERREASFRDLDVQIKERLFLSITDLVVLAIFLAISPSVREAFSAYTREDSKDIALLRSYQMQVATIQRDAVWWLHTIVPKMFKPNRAEFVHCLHKVLFMEQAEHYYNKDNWPPEGERLLMLRLASEVPILEDTLMRILIIGLSREHSMNPPDALELADQIVKRAALVYMEDFPVVHVERTDLFDAVFNLCAYHHPENLTLPQGYQPPNLAIFELYWKAWSTLLIIVAHNPLNFGQTAWDSYPTLRNLMEMCITNHFTFPPPTLAMGEKADEILNRELQMSQMEKDQILEFESHLAAASTKVTITESNSLLISKLITMNPLGLARKPPPAVLEQLKSLNQKLKLGHLLCRSRNPDFLLDIIQRQGTSQSMPWLAELVESSEGSFRMLPVQCLCEFLLNESPDGVDTFTDESKDENKGEKSKIKKKRKQQQLLFHLQALLHDRSEESSVTAEVLDYFMRRLSSQQSSARILAAKGLYLVLSQPNRSPESDDEDLDKDAAIEHSWLLKYLPLLPHFDAVKLQVIHALRQACQVESDPSAVNAYVRFLAAYSPDENVQDLADLALDMAQLIIERPTIINCILPPDNCSSGTGGAFLMAVSQIFSRYLNKAKEPSKEVYAWSESQDHIIVQWATGEAATMHILVVHAMVILLTYGIPEGDRTIFDELLETWFPDGNDPPQAFLVDTSEEALLFPDWLKLRMIRSSVDTLVDAALKDLDPAQLMLFIQSFGIPVLSMSKLLKTLDLAVEYDSYAVNQAVVDKTYMSQLVEVQHRRGAQGGDKFAKLLEETEDVDPAVTIATPPAQTPVIQRAPPKPPVPIHLESISRSMLQLFGLDASVGILSNKQEQELFKGLQKALTQDILNKSTEHGALAEFVSTCEHILQSGQKYAFVHALHRKSFGAVLFRLATVAQANADLKKSRLAYKLLWVCHQLMILSEGFVSSLSTVIQQYVMKHSSPGNSRETKVWSQVISRIKLTRQQLSSEDIINVIKQVEHDEPVRLEEVVRELMKDAVSAGDTQQVVIAMTKLLIENVMDRSIKSLDSSKFSCFVDWLEKLEPGLIASCPESQRQLLFSKQLTKSRVDQSNKTLVPFRPYLLALLTHQAGWETLHYCMDFLLHSATAVNSYDATSVLDFLWACIHIPKIWQGRDKKQLKHHIEEDVLALHEKQVHCVVDYILEEALMNWSQPEANDETGDRSLKPTVVDQEVSPIITFRLPLLLRCCCASRSLLASAAKHLMKIITTDSKRSLVGRHLLLHMYLQVPSLLMESWEANIFNKTQFIQSSYSKLDVISHTLLTSLATTDDTKSCTDRMADIELACRKMASAHPVLLLRQLAMLSALLRGRVNFGFRVFRERNHMNLFTCVLGLLELLPPHLFKPEYKSALEDILSSYLELFQAYGAQNRDLMSLLNRFVLLLHQYLATRPSNARDFVQAHSDQFQDLSAVAPDMTNLHSLLAGTSLAHWESSGLLRTNEEKNGEKDLFSIPPGGSASGPTGWSQSQLVSLNKKLSGNPEDVYSGLLDLENISNKKPSILDFFLDDLKKLIQETHSNCRSTAFNLVLKHLKNNPRDSRHFISPYLQCLESDDQDIVSTSLDHLPEFVLLAQEYATLLLQSAFTVGITTNINTVPQICETLVLLNMQSGS